jgi:hypothetical protein
MADIKLAYDIAAFDVGVATVSFASLTADTSLLAGLETSPVDNTLSTLSVEDFLVSGSFRAVSTAARVIEVWAIGSVDGTIWPSVFDGTNSSETIPSANVKANICKFIAAIATDNTGTTARDYDFGPVSLASAFGGIVPPKFLFFVTHSNTSALDSTAGAHFIRLKPIYRNIN